MEEPSNGIVYLSVYDRVLLPSTSIPLRASLMARTDYTSDWHFAAIRHNGSVCELRIDDEKWEGVYVGSLGYSATGGVPAYFQLGGNTVPTYLNGSIDEVAVFNSYLSNADINRIYNNNNGLSYS